MSRTPRLLPLVAIAIGGVLALKLVASLDGAPDFLRAAKAFAEEGPAPPRGAARAPKVDPKPLRAGPADKTMPAMPKDPLAAGSEAAPVQSASQPGGPAPICAPSAAELAKEAGLSPAELRVLQSLQSRRGELDARAQALETQLAVLSAAEAKVDGKLKSLDALKAEIQGLLGQADQKQDSEVQRLVLVYSAMKPQDAAAVMAQLDDRVRIPVAAKMKERVLAAILAKMPPAEAKKVTERLAGRYSAADSLAAKVAEASQGPAAEQAVTPVDKTPISRPAVKRRPRRAVAKADAGQDKAPAKPAVKAQAQAQASPPKAAPTAPPPTKPSAGPG